ncbi:MAG: cytochrome c oxidase subunit II [Paracoccaceae bacterium]
MRLSTYFKGLAAAGLTALTSTAVAAQGLEIIGEPTGGEMGFQPPSTSLAVEQQWLDHMLLWVCIGVMALVCGLLLFVILRFNSRANPTPRRFTHNTPLEVAWTIVPVMVLLFIGSFSLPALYNQQEFPEGDVVIKVTGNQWYWSYEYPNEGIPSFDSFLVDGAYKIDDVAAGWGDDQPMGPRQVLDDVAIKKLEYFGYGRKQFLLATDTAVVVPVGKAVVMQITSADVIHSWKIPSFAVMQDAVPGRIAHVWFRADKEGIYFGQCSELCGKDHAYMPITVKVVSEAAYAKWVESAKAGNVMLTAEMVTAGDTAADVALAD